MLSLMDWKENAAALFLGLAVGSDVPVASREGEEVVRLPYLDRLRRISSREAALGLRNGGGEEEERGGDGGGRCEEGFWLSCALRLVLISLK